MPVGRSRHFGVHSGAGTGRRQLNTPTVGHEAPEGGPYRKGRGRGSELTPLPFPAGVPAFWLLLPCPHLPGDQDGAGADSWWSCQQGLGVAGLLLFKGVVWTWEGGRARGWAKI